MITGTAAQILVKTLAINGVERVSTVAGESYLAVLDALLDSNIKVITCRQEGGASFMAESWGKLTGKPGVCFVTRGPGACNASIGVHTAMQDSTPMILFMGQVRRHERGREAFQEIDVREVFGGLAKWATEIDDPARIPEILHHAFTVAISDRPGPVVIGLPEDMLRETASVHLTGPALPVMASPAKLDLDRLADMLGKASRPLVIVGGSGWSDRDCNNIMSFANACHLPVAASFRRHDIFNHRNHCYVGELGTGPNPKLLEKVKEADLLLVIGARMNEIMTQGYTVPPVPCAQTLIHVHAGAGELGKVYEPALAIQSGVAEIAAALAGIGLTIKGRGWAGWREELRANYESWSSLSRLREGELEGEGFLGLPDRKQALPPGPPPSRRRGGNNNNEDGGWNGADMTAIFAFLRDALPADAIVTTDAGNFSGWAQRYLHYGRPGRLLAPTSGAMGYGLPAALGASLAAPECLTLGICGDGGFMMTGQELATAMHHGAKPILLICNNNMYGTIRMHQEKNYPGRVSATALTNPDFVKLAESYGAFAARVKRAEQFPGVWDQVLKAGKAAVIEIAMDPAQLTTNSKVTG